MKHIIKRTLSNGLRVNIQERRGAYLIHVLKKGKISYTILNVPFDELDEMLHDLE